MAVSAPQDPVHQFSLVWSSKAGPPSLLSRRPDRINAGPDPGEIPRLFSALSVRWVQTMPLGLLTARRTGRSFPSTLFPFTVISCDAKTFIPHGCRPAVHRYFPSSIRRPLPPGAESPDSPEDFIQTDPVICLLHCHSYFSNAPPVRGFPLAILINRLLSSSQPSFLSSGIATVFALNSSSFLQYIHSALLFFFRPPTPVFLP